MITEEKHVLEIRQQPPNWEKIPPMTFQGHSEQFGIVKRKPCQSYLNAI